MAFDSRTVAIFASYTAPYKQVYDNYNVRHTLSARVISLGLIIMTENMFNSNSEDSLSQNQLDTYMQVEEAFDGLNLNGRGCLLRLICEVQKAELSDNSFIVWMLREFLKPVGDERATILEDYVAAQEYGLQGFDVCTKQYSNQCDFSTLETLAAEAGYRVTKQFNNNYNYTSSYVSY